MLNEGNFNAAQMLEGENEDEDNLGDVASPETMVNSRGKAGKQQVKKKKSGSTAGGSGLGQRKVFNNYMNEN